VAAPPPAARRDARPDALEEAQVEAAMRD